MHGLPTSKELFEPVVEQLRGKFRLITFDLNDYGQSDRLDQPISHRDRARVLDELRAHVGLDRFALVAHDLGASVAIDYMDGYGEHVQKLVLISPPVYPDFNEPAIVKLARLPFLGDVLVHFFKGALFRLGIGMGMVHKERFTKQLREAFAGPFSGREGEQALLRILRWGRPGEMFADYPRIIRSISVPTLIIQGRRDPYIPMDQALRLRQDIQGSKLKVVEDGGHFLPIDTPEAVAQALDEFLV